jgi:hypothetical protein
MHNFNINACLIAPGRSRWIFRAKKSSARLPSEVKWSRLSHVVLYSIQKNPKVTWKSPLSAKFLGHFSPIVPHSAVGFASVASDAGGLLWWKLERSKSLVLLQVGGLKCRWQRHSVKSSCWECSTTVEQAETQLRVVVPIEGEEACLLAIYAV